MAIESNAWTVELSLYSDLIVFSPSRHVIDLMDLMLLAIAFLSIMSQISFRRSSHLMIRPSQTSEPWYNFPLVPKSALHSI